MTTSNKPRQTRTPAQKAAAALAVEERRVAKLEAKRDTLKTELASVQHDLEAAEARRAYLAANPDLPANAATAEE